MAEVLGAQSSQDSAPFTPPASGSFVSGEEKAAMIQKVKQEVKRLMEEAVTRKFIHEDSSSVRSLCGMFELQLFHLATRSFSKYSLKLSCCCSPVAVCFDISYFSGCGSVFGSQTKERSLELFQYRRTVEFTK